MPCVIHQNDQYAKNLQVSGNMVTLWAKNMIWNTRIDYWNIILKWKKLILLGVCRSHRRFMISQWILIFIGNFTLIDWKLNLIAKKFWPCSGIFGDHTNC